jgi:predicted RNA binding protein YcfA (HicA-like mRNA interferase family)
MPPKIRELIAELERAGFINRGGKGSHRNYRHPKGYELTLSGQTGADAQKYQEKLVKKALKEVKK